MTKTSESISNDLNRRGWKSIQKTQSSKIDDLSWFEGYFWEKLYGWDGDTWIRNLHEIRTRDIAVTALGDIRGKRCLDIGCGNGIYTLLISYLGAEASGQDLSEQAIDRARELLKITSQKAEFKIGDAVNLQFPSNYFDTVFSADFFEHISIEQKRKVLQEIYRVLVPGGYLVIKTPNISHLKLSIYLKRIAYLLTFRSPLIYIAHTHNNPDNEHHGLTSFRIMRQELEALCFHTPEFHYQPLVRRGIPQWLTDFLLWTKIKIFSEHLIISTKKSIFVGAAEVFRQNK